MGTISKLLSLLKNHRVSLQNAFNHYDEHMHKVSLRRKYGLEQLEIVDYLDLVSEQVTVRNYTFLGGNSLITDMALIKFLLSKIHKAVFLEIGSWRGETLSNAAEVAETCYSVTLGKAEMKALGMSQMFETSHGLFTKGLQNVNYFFGNSLTFDFSSLPEKADLIFVDGDHSYEAVKSDTTNAFNSLKSDDSIIIWHDYGFHTEQVRHSVLEGILDGTPADKRGKIYHVSNTMCAIYLNQKVQSKKINFPVLPNKIFDVTINVEKIN